MIAELKPYPKYENSGLSWPERVPEHWHVRQLGVPYSELEQCGRMTGLATAILSLARRSATPSVLRRTSKRTVFAGRDKPSRYCSGKVLVVPELTCKWEM